MSLPVVLRAEAEAEFDVAFDYYDAERAGLGTKFAVAVQAAFDWIAVHPLALRVVIGDVRRRLVRRFPYAIMYRAHDDRIEVLAVFHTRRDPSVWMKRI